MSKQIPMDEPLSDDNREYLNMMGNHALIDRLDAMHGQREEEDDGSVVADPRETLESDLTAESRNTGDIGAVDADPAAVRYVTTPGATDDEAGPANEYNNWTKSELEDELESRGLSRSGNKADLVTRLEDDDNAT